MRIKSLEALMGMLARHMEFYTKNNAGTPSDHAQMKQQFEISLNGARSEHQTLKRRLEQPDADWISSPQAPVGLAQAGQAADGARRDRRPVRERDAAADEKTKSARNAGSDSRDRVAARREAGNEGLGRSRKLADR